MIGNMTLHEPFSRLYFQCDIVYKGVSFAGGSFYYVVIS